MPLFAYYERRRRYLTIIAAIYLLLPLFTYYESRHRYLTILRGVAAICLLPSQCDRYLPIMALFDYFEVDLPLYGIYPILDSLRSGEIAHTAPLDAHNAQLSNGPIRASIRVREVPIQQCQLLTSHSTQLWS